MIRLLNLKKILNLYIIILLLFSGFAGTILFENIFPINGVEAKSTWKITTDTDFSNGTLKNLDIKFSGSDAELRLKKTSKWIKELPAEMPEFGWKHKVSSVYGDDKAILFGGGRYDPTDYTWKYDYNMNKWTEMYQNYKPGPRGDHDLAPIYGTSCVLLFGGEYEGGMDYFYYGDTWIYNTSNNNWTDKKPINAPSLRSNHMMVSVYGEDKAILFGGYFREKGTSYHYEDIWIYDLSDNNWTKTSQSFKPKLKKAYCISSIYGTDKILLFTHNYYYTAVGLIYGETWIYDVSENKWTNKTKKDQITPLASVNMAPIHGTDKILLFGGFPDLFSRETWIYDLNDNEWTKESPLNYPMGGSRHEMSTIYGTDKVLLTHSSDGAIWVYDLSDNNWFNKTRLIAPYGNSIYLASIYNTDKILYFGGHPSGISNDTWIYDCSEANWEKKIPKKRPDGRNSYSIASFYGHDKVLLFGGLITDLKGTNSSNDTWIYDLSDNKWTQKKPNISPRMRHNHKMASIYGTDKILLFSGSSWDGKINDYCNDTWLYDLSDNSWVQVQTKANLSYRNNFVLSSIYNQDKVILYGGYYYDENSSIYYNKTWIFDLSDYNWTQKTQAIFPESGYGLALSMIHNTDKVILYKGKYEKSETWIYDLSENNWVRKTITNSYPELAYHNFLVPIFNSKKVFLSDGNGYNIWTYNLETNIWSSNTMYDRPIGYGSQILLPIYGDDKAVMTSGSSVNWVYDYSENSWSKIVTDIMPNSLYETNSATFWGTDQIFCFGGQNRSGNLNETWIFDLSDSEWTQIHPQIDPGKWDDFGLVAIHKTKNILFYGTKYNYTSHQYESETWIFNLIEKEWTQIYPTGNPSWYNSRLITSVYNDDKIIFFSDESAWIFDYSENKWSNKVFTKRIYPKHYPCTSFIFGENKILLYTGDPDELDEKPKSMIYDLDSNTWTEFVSNQYPGYDYYQTMAPIFGTNKVVHFGGHDDDTWIFHLDIYVNGTYVSEPHFTDYNTTFHNLKWAKHTNKYTDVEFQIRTSDAWFKLKSKEFIGPNGLPNTYYSSSPTTLWKGHQNDSCIQIKAYLNTTNLYHTPILKSISLEYNRCPRFFYYDLTPSYGDIRTKFNFTARYHDYDNDAPKFVFVCIDGINYSMKESDKDDTVYDDGKRYWLNTKLLAGNHTYRFFASDGDMECSSSITNLTVNFGPLHHIEIEPSQAILEIGNYQIFTAKCYDEDNNSLSLNPSWSTNGGGEIDQNGNYSANKLGTWFVYANYSSISDQSIITVIEKTDDKDGNNTDKNNSDPKVNNSENDLDKDGMLDDWEMRFGFNITNPNDAFLDADEDNLTNLEEYLYNTNPLDSDSDNDNIPDGDEIKIYGTDPLRPDSITNGKIDGEDKGNETDPLDTDIPEKDNEQKSKQPNNYVIFAIFGFIITLILIIIAIFLYLKWKKK
jgi:hypothetical protein